MRPKRGSLLYHAAGSALTSRKAHVNSRVNSDTSRFLNAPRSSAVLHTGAFASSTPQWPARSGTHSLVVVCASCPGTKSSSTPTRSSYQISPLWISPLAKMAEAAIAPKIPLSWAGMARTTQRYGVKPSVAMREPHLTQAPEPPKLAQQLEVGGYGPDVRPEFFGVHCKFHLRSGRNLHHAGLRL
jgi:hypothetical protein